MQVGAVIDMAEDIALHLIFNKLTLVRDTCLATSMHGTPAVALAPNGWWAPVVT